jgi:hypothetical protein
MSAVNVEAVGRTLRVLLEQAERPILYRDPATGTHLTVDPQTVGSPTGFLPPFVVAAEAVWREATGKGFALDMIRDPDALLGYRLRAIGAGSFTTVMLASMEAINQVARPEAIVISEFNALWSAATDRVRRDAQEPPRRTYGARP